MVYVLRISLIPCRNLNKVSMEYQSYAKLTKRNSRIRTQSMSQPNPNARNK